MINIPKSTSLVSVQWDEDENIMGLVDANGRAVNVGGGGGSTGPVVSSLSVASPLVNSGTNNDPVVGLPTPTAITASRNLTAADNGKTLYNATGNAYTLTVPTGLPLGFAVTVVQASTGVVTLAAAAGVTIANKDNYTKTGGQNAVMSIFGLTAIAYISTGSGAA